ncbi:MAG: nuclear transport factor 2 family protein [Melioribacteraceae bacterium]|nr:nuclear transport factor 2 family protein [Melioribacteraceae bacterium]
MKKIFFALLMIPFTFNYLYSQNNSNEDEIINLSKLKWEWMAEKNIEELEKLFHEKSVFVHMGGSWGKVEEINIIKSGGIWYKKTEIHNVSVKLIDNTAILLN